MRHVSTLFIPQGHKFRTSRQAAQLSFTFGDDSYFPSATLLPSPEDCKNKELDIGYKPGQTEIIFSNCNIFSGEVGFCRVRLFFP